MYMYVKESLMDSYLSIAAAAKLLPSCLTLCDPIDGSPQGSAAPGILQAKILEWVAISFSKASSRSRDQTCVSCTRRQILCHWAIEKEQQQQQQNRAKSPRFTFSNTENKSKNSSSVIQQKQN